MNSGRGVGTSVNVTIENYGSSEHEVQQISPNEILIIARQAISQDTPGIVARQLSNPNSRVSKSMSQNTKSKRRR